MLIGKRIHRRVGIIWKKLHKVLSADSLRSSGEKKNSLVIESGGREEGDGLWVAIVPLLFRKSVRRSNKSQETASFALYEGDTTRPINIPGKTFGFVCLRGNTDDEVDDSLRQVTGSLEEGGLNVAEWFGTERSRTL